MSAPYKSPDIRDLSGQNLGAGKFPAGPLAFRTWFDPATHAQIHVHAHEDTSVEICGVLVGQIEKDEQGPFVRVTNSIRGESAESKFAEVTFTHQSWNKINAEMDSKYQNLRIVGWYHTHPNFGIFLSDRDCFIQENFFNGPGQIAHVVDPIQKIEGVFQWCNGKPEIAQFFWVGADTKLAPPPAGHAVARLSSGDALGEGAAGPPVPLASNQDLLWALIGCVLFFLGYLLSAYLTGRLNDYEKQTLAKQQVRDVLVWKLYRPDFEDRVRTNNKVLITAATAVRDMAKEQIDAADKKDREELAKRWDQVLQVFQAVARDQDEIIQKYTPNEQERKLLKNQFDWVTRQEKDEEERLERERKKSAESATKDKESTKKDKDSNSTPTNDVPQKE